MQPRRKSQNQQSDLLLADLLGEKQASETLLSLRDSQSLSANVPVSTSVDFSEDNITAGDFNDDPYQAAVVGEEAPGGDNPTPDQNVSEFIEEAVGLITPDGFPIDTMRQLEQRDSHRWELDPSSSEDERL
jgi:hypothetical protein